MCGRKSNSKRGIRKEKWAGEEGRGEGTKTERMVGGKWEVESGTQKRGDSTS